MNVFKSISEKNEEGEDKDEKKDELEKAISGGPDAPPATETKILTVYN